MTGYKICFDDDYSYELETKSYYDLFVKESCGMLVILEIPDDALVVESSEFNKCRCDKALVSSIYRLQITNLLDNKYSFRICYDGYLTCYSAFAPNPLIYVEGEYVYSDTLNLDCNDECTNGIHFFKTLQEALSFLQLILEYSRKE